MSPLVMPVSGNITRLGWVTSTEGPGGMAAAFFLRDLGSGSLAEPICFGLRAFPFVFLSAGEGVSTVSRIHAWGDLSSRKPWNEGCRMLPSRVHSENSICPTSLG